MPSWISWIYSHTPLAWYIQSYWRDEAFSVMLAREPLAKLILVTASDYSPPLYPLLLKVWIMLLGSSELATRSLSLLCYTLTVFLIVETLVHVYHMRARTAAVYGIALGLLSPILTYYAFETRGYALLALASIASTYALLCRRRTMYCVTVMVGLMTHYFMIYVVISHAVVVLARTDTHWTRRQYLLTLVPPGVILILWMSLVALVKPLSDGAFWIVRPVLLDLLQSLGMVLTGYESDFRFRYDLWPVALITTLMPAIYLLRRKHISWSDAVMGTTVALPLLLVYIQSLVMTPLWLPRYLIIATPHLLVLIAISLHHYKPIYRVVLVILLSMILVDYQSSQIKYRTKENMSSLLGALVARTTTSDYLTVESELDYHLAQYYWHRPDHVRITGRQYDEIPSYTGKALIPRGALSVPPCEDGLCHVYLMTSDRTIRLVR